MHEIDTRDREHESALDRKTTDAPKEMPDARGRRGARLFGLGAFLLLAAGLAFGASRSYSKQREVTATAEQIRDFVPSVRVPGCSASAIRITMPGKLRSGISGTRTTASTPGLNPKA